MISIGNLQINKLCLGDVEVTKAYLGDVQVYGPKPKPEGKYMTMTVLDGDAGTTIAPTVKGSITPNLQYRINNGEWSDFIVGTTADIQVVSGDWVQFKGVNESGIADSIENYLNFAVSGNPVALSGNVMSLIDGVGETLIIPNDYCFFSLFRNSAIKTVSSDLLPATTLTPNCYQGMFINCKALEIAPELPATIVKNYCYSSMFSGCTSLVTAPELPATTLASNCYNSMFDGCTSLVTVHELPATTLTNSCYSYMFNGCTALVNAPVLPATILDDYCYEYMFNGCTALVNAPVLPATTLAYFCYSNMFCDCTSLTQAPELPATTLDDYCYLQMFNGCTSLTTAPKILPATTLASYCYNNMFYGCTSLTQAPVLPATTLASYCYMSMFIGCKSLTKAPVLPATTLASYCYMSMFKGCQNLNYVKSLATNITATNALNQWLSGVAASGTFVKTIGVGYPTGDSGIPSGWKVEEYVQKYMTITVDESNTGSTTISPTIKGSLPTLNLQYRINNGDWNDFIVGTTADINVVAGDVVQWKGMNTGGLSIDTKNYLNFVISGNPVHLSGNVMSLIDDVGDALEIPCNYCFYYLFSSSNVKTVSSDFLPATTLTTNCYEGMFQSCSSLTQAPELPATTLKDYCYVSMFQSCDALTKAPELPATTLGVFCYQFMFYLCSSLTQAPSVLPATTLKDYCYYYMFGYCSKLSRIKCLATNISATYCTSGWLSGVASSGTFVKPAGVSYKSGSSGIPSGWTVEEI